MHTLAQPGCGRSALFARVASEVTTVTCGNRACVYHCPATDETCIARKGANNAKRHQQSGSEDMMCCTSSLSWRLGAAECCKRRCRQQPERCRATESKSRGMEPSAPQSCRHPAAAGESCPIEIHPLHARFPKVQSGAIAGGSASLSQLVPYSPAAAQTYLGRCTSCFVALTWAGRDHTSQRSKACVYMILCETGSVAANGPAMHATQGSAETLLRHTKTLQWHRM